MKSQDQKLVRLFNKITCICQRFNCVLIVKLKILLNIVLLNIIRRSYTFLICKFFFTYNGAYMCISIMINEYLAITPAGISVGRIYSQQQHFDNIILLFISTFHFAFDYLQNNFALFWKIAITKSCHENKRQQQTIQWTCNETCNEHLIKTSEIKWQVSPLKIHKNRHKCHKKSLYE